MKHIVTFAFLALLASAPVAAQGGVPPPPPPPPPEPEPVQRWIPLYQDDSRTVLIDMDTIEDAGRNVTFWLEWQYASTLETTQDNPYNRSKERMEVRCGSRELRNHYIALYTNEALVTSYSGDRLWSPVIPETIGETVANEVCSVYGRE